MSVQVAYNLNGGQPLTGLADYQVANKIKSNLPPNTYTSIQVRTVQYKFPAQTAPVPTREITLCHSTLLLTWECFTAFLKGLIGMKSDQSSINSQLVMAQLVGNNGTSAGLDEVKKAYKQCQAIEIRISEDCNSCEIKLEQYTYYVVAQKAGETGQAIIKGVIALGPVAIQIATTILTRHPPQIPSTGNSNGGSTTTTTNSTTTQTT